MNLAKIPMGKNPPHEVNVIIEIPKGGEPIKYEIDKDSGALFVDRFLHTSMVYPGNYGFIPHTLSADGDPVDVLVVGNRAIVPGAVLPCRPIGVIMMEDESGLDEKIIAVAADRLHPFYAGVKSYEDLPKILCDTIAHFFTHYKDLEKNKWVKIAEWRGPEAAEKIIMEGFDLANKDKKSA